MEWFPCYLRCEFNRLWQKRFIPSPYVSPELAFQCQNGKCTVGRWSIEMRRSQWIFTVTRREWFLRDLRCKYNILWKIRCMSSPNLTPELVFQCQNGKYTVVRRNVESHSCQWMFIFTRMDGILRNLWCEAYRLWWNGFMSFLNLSTELAFQRWNGKSTVGRRKNWNAQYWMNI